ncbi:hypothetical protein ACL02R_17075 [Streptomyces sp. MS19]|uniref:hypothetical protein n=1 Tax=Streptomyces sp. MS19 TaxID=3385972 RepID=UPI0039A1B03E
MAQRNIRLAALLRETNFSHKSLARAVVSTAALSGEKVACDHTYVTRWLKGTIPRGNVPWFVADAIGRRLGRRLTVDDVGMGAAAVSAVRPDLGLDLADRPETVARTVADLWRADLANAEVLLRTPQDPTVWSVAALYWLVAPPDGPLARTGDCAVSARDVDTVRSTADAFSELDGTFGGGHARHALIQYLHTDVRPMLDGTYSDAVGKQLYSAVAEALLLAGWMSYDSCLHSIAQRYFVQALRMTQAAGDRRLGGSVLSAMSHQATFLGRYRDALALARAAYIAPGTDLGPTMAAQFRAMEARAHAQLGDARACDQALAEAERQLDGRTVDSDPPYISYFDETELAAEIAHCHRDLGRSVDATVRRTGFLLGNGSHTRSNFFVTMVQAEAYIHHSETGRGFELALDALRIGEGLKSARCLQYVRQLHSRVTDSMRQAAGFRDFEERARGFRLWRQAGVI